LPFSCPALSAASAIKPRYTSADKAELAREDDKAKGNRDYPIREKSRMIEKEQQATRMISIAVISIAILYLLLSTYNSLYHSSSKSLLHSDHAPVNTPTEQSIPQENTQQTHTKATSKKKTIPKHWKNTILIQKPLPPKIPLRRANAAFVMLVRNTDALGARSTIRQIEDRFNRNFQYPYVFLNDVPFTEEFKELVRPMSRANMTFGLVPKEHWSYPEWVSTKKAAEARIVMKEIVYGWSESYRHMCRYDTSASRPFVLYFLNGGEERERLGELA
jgi:hypothetical protein